jgi:hypothetical protein
MATDDILWRRSKLGLHLSPETIASLTHWLGNAKAAPKARAQ